MRYIFILLSFMLAGRVYAQAVADQVQQDIQVHVSNMNNDLAAAAQENAIIQNLENDQQPQAQALIQANPTLQSTIATDSQPVGAVTAQPMVNST